MAQFVTHIQPTLMEASHHHSPMHYHKDIHKDHHLKDHHHMELSKHKEHKEHKDLESHYKDMQAHQGHPRDFPVLPSQHPHEHHHHHHGSSDHRHAQSEHVPSTEKGQYMDAYGKQHEYQMHFIDSQGIYRDYQGHGVDEMSKDDERSAPKTKAVPPQYIDLQPLYNENKVVSDLIFL